ncbi:MAG: DapH/DapD/GlmU-related protein [Solirubrobacteraceae bacterium]
MDVIFAAASHELGEPERRATGVLARPIVIGDGCWIGARATILAGVTIGAGCVVGAGAVVVADTQPNCVYAGVPARRLRELDGVAPANSPALHHSGA